MSGFTLVETLVALSVLLLVVSGPLTLTSRISNSSQFASEQAVAHFLAQEGLELAQKARDDLLLRWDNFPSGGTISNPWAQFISNQSGALYQACHAVAGCGLVIQNNGSLDVNSCATAGACLLKEVSTPTTNRARFNNDTGTPSPYTRVIRFEAANANQLRVVVEVTWRSGTLLASQRVRLESYLFNIYAAP
jgi:prepilin-type N-terminal cleavage/methylation domain-containing protein